MFSWVGFMYLISLHTGVVVLCGDEGCVVWLFIWRRQTGSVTMVGIFDRDNTRLVLV